MTIKEAVLKSLEDIEEPTHYKDILKHIQKNKYYDFSDSKTPDLTISGTLTGFIQKGDIRVQRIKNDKGKYLYYLTKNEQDVDVKISESPNKSQTKILI
nr:HTH domain-containing protein [Pseudodesulfovibrio sp.]